MGAEALGMQLVPQVGQWVGLAVAMRGESSQSGGGEVGEFQAGAGQFGAETGDLR
jgi:hypothetical protein